MAFKNIKTSINNGIMIITISRQERLNALNFETLGELNKVIKELYNDISIMGAIITGEGEKAFVAGADITEISKLNEMNGRKSAETGQEIFQMIENCPKLIIAAVNGYALGGGCELAMACHLRVMSENAKFGQPEINLGIIPGYGGTQRLPWLVGKGKALELMLTADMVNANDAKEMGWANYITSQENLIPKCLEILNKIITKPAISVGLIIDCVNTAFHKQEDGFQTEANAFAACISTGDFKEGTAAFIEKRVPVFKGK
ncbi:MAG: enoyl-CoA hydratase [Cytophagales bacterium]|nr:MAG: enoyl-CoA hydratase [Cytophagales bacterium]